MSNSVPATPKRGFTIDHIRGIDQETGKPLRSKLVPGENPCLYTTTEIGLGIDMMLRFRAVVQVSIRYGGELFIVSAVPNGTPGPVFVVDDKPGSTGIHLSGGD